MNIFKDLIEDGPSKIDNMDYGKAKLAKLTINEIHKLCEKYGTYIYRFGDFSDNKELINYIIRYSEYLSGNTVILSDNISIGFFANKEFYNIIKDNIILNSFIDKDFDSEFEKFYFLKIKNHKLNDKLFNFKINISSTIYKKYLKMPLLYNVS